MTGVEPATGLVAIVNETLVLPAGTRTDVGTLPTDGLSLLSDIDAPPIGAAPVRVTVPWETRPPNTLVGLTAIEFKEVGPIIRVAVSVASPQTAVITTGVGPETGLVVIANEALALPAGTMTDPGTLATDGVSLLKVIDTPPFGAGPLKVTVPWETIPPTTLIGFTPIEFRTGGMTVREAVLVAPLKVADKVARVEVDTALVAIENAALVLPAGTTTEAGTEATDGVSLLKVIDTPPLGAAPVSVTVPWEAMPP